MLHKVGVEQNNSYYGVSGSSHRGNRDFILNLVWHSDFTKKFERHLSASKPGEPKNEEAMNFEHV